MLKRIAFRRHSDLLNPLRLHTFVCRMIRLLHPMASTAFVRVLHDPRTHDSVEQGNLASARDKPQGLVHSRRDYRYIRVAMK